MDELTVLKSRVGRARMALGERKGQQQRVLQDRQAVIVQLEECKEQQRVFDQVILLLQQTSEHARRQAREQIEMLVTSTLRTVMGGEYTFRIELTERAGRPEAEFYVVSQYGEELLQTRPQDSRGGGVVDVLSFGLRIAMLQTYQPRLEGPLILDEPAKHVSDEFIAPTARFLTTVSHFFGRQVIMVTHNPHLAENADRSYQVTLRDQVSEVNRVSQGAQM